METKLLIKVCSDSHAKSPIPDTWVHLCYVETELFEKFLKIADTNIPLNAHLSKWCQEDFHVENPVTTQDQLTELKQCIKNMYKSMYPDLYRETAMDRQGWVRAWITKKIKETVENGETRN